MLANGSSRVEQTMEAGRSQLEGRKIRIRMDDAELTIACVDDGELAVGGGPSDSHLVALVHDYMYENLLSRGSTLSGVLRVAKRIAQAFNGEVLDLENVLEFVRRGWIRLLVANLMADPSQSIGERMNEFRAHRGLPLPSKQLRTTLFIAGTLWLTLAIPNF